ncbi:purine nucleoside permease [Paraglaciecola sp. T6c]|uniref:cupin domain-containing protein n=1 Tax=Pseudoalteromonas atlantica (strain T6c / ATCC BAA-1087) TaxID=3042615 RepID=UPI00005C5170|nr:cupin domain-containing protein [Paraglaciecola sp. T6c]ABG40744.1 purine nucleoside permease [Paraglaciecola sp. T6c]
MLKTFSKSALCLTSILFLNLALTACQSTTPSSTSSPSSAANTSQAATEMTQPLEIKVVVVTMFEIGEDDDDKPGEFQMWKEGQNLDTRYAFPMSHHDIYVNEDTGVMGIVTGMGTAKAAAAIMALGLDPRFDLTHAYWLVAGIAGVDPQDASIGSAVWANWLVDGDLAHEIDAREIPADWKSGYFPLFSVEPISADPVTPSDEKVQAMNGEAYQLNTQLTKWAYELSKDTALSDYPAMYELREKYLNYPNARKRPFVLIGDHMAAATFWHGNLLNEWANDWSAYWSNGQANFVTSGMEDTGSYQSMIYLDNAQKADKSRFMVLRAASNYSMQPDSLTAANNLAMESGENGYAGMQSALESAYSVGSVVVNDIIANWDIYKDALPYEASKVAPDEDTLNEMLTPTTEPVDAKLSAEELIKSLNLTGHVEGGFYRQTFKADHRPMLSTEHGERVNMTSIYYLLSAKSPIGHFHMNRSDIMHYFHVGDPITYYLLNQDGSLETHILGPDPTQGHEMQMVVKGGTWKASKISTTGDYGYGLIGEAVAPGFEYQDMQLAEQAELVSTFPQHSDLIKTLTR